MEFSKDFFEDEVRDGFYIPGEIKQAWAAELSVLWEVDKVCRKYNIPYFADWGTLLGAVRHGGYIPWDDDLDITMKRADFNRFMSIAAKELPEGFEAYNYRQKENYWGFVARVVSRNRICFEEDHLEKYHGFPYMAGVDIFVLDYVAKDENREKERVTIANYVLTVADNMAEGILSGKEADIAISRIEKICKVEINRNVDINKLRTQLYNIVESLFGMFNEDESDTLTRMMPEGIQGSKDLRLPKRYYEEWIRLPFEGMMIPVPAAYDEMLRKRYGDYMRLVRNVGGHDYPYFESQQKDLERVMGSKMPGYSFDKKYLVETKPDNEYSLKNQGRKYVEESVRQIKTIENYISSDIQKVLDEIADAQQYAIDMATLIERCKGEAYVTVGYIEEYCEALYEIYSLASGQGNNEELRDKLIKLNTVSEAVNKSIEEDIIERKEVVFLPFKAQYWNSFKSVYEETIKDSKCDVYVIPIPYYHKKYDGVLYDMEYDGNEFPENVVITDYNEYDFKLHCPETVFIQNPYDEWHKTMSVLPYFHSSNIKKYTKELVYIPYFKLYEFTKDSYREYHNMEYYCTMPGVVNSHKVIVQSENMRQLYIEKLVEFAGEDTRSVWEGKIKGTGSPIDDIVTVVNDSDIPKEWQDVIMKADGSRKKVIACQVAISGIVQYKEKALDKIREVLDIFDQYKEDIALILYLDTPTMEELDEEYIKLWDRYKRLIETAIDSNFAILTEGDGKMLSKLCDGYYGDSGMLAQRIGVLGKPVMIMDYDIIMDV